MDDGGTGVGRGIRSVVHTLNPHRVGRRVGHGARSLTTLLAVSAVVSLVYPRRCAGCQRDGVDVCRACLGALEPGWRSAIGGAPAVRFAAPYSGWVRQALIDYKSGAEYQVHALAAVLRTVLPPPSLVVPVPTTRAKVAQRGFDTVTALAQAADAVCLPVLQVTRPVADQVGLGARQRRANLHGAFRATALVGPRVWVLDDVVTTGATLGEAARALRLAGARDIVGVALCSAQG